MEIDKGIILQCNCLLFMIYRVLYFCLSTSLFFHCFTYCLRVYCEFRCYSMAMKMIFKMTVILRKSIYIFNLVFENKCDNTEKGMLSNSKWIFVVIHTFYFLSHLWIYNFLIIISMNSTQTTIIKTFRLCFLWTE